MMNYKRNISRVRGCLQLLQNGGTFVLGHHGRDQWGRWRLVHKWRPLRHGELQRWQRELAAARRLVFSIYRVEHHTAVGNASSSGIEGHSLRFSEAQALARRLSEGSFEAWCEFRIIRDDGRIMEVWHAVYRE